MRLEVSNLTLWSLSVTVFMLLVLAGIIAIFGLTWVITTLGTAMTTVLVILILLAIVLVYKSVFQ